MSTTAPASATNNPETWARFLEERTPGLTWLASTLLEWAELPPGARRAWTVSVLASRAGEIESLAAMHEESGVLAVASKPDVPAPFLGTPDRVKRIVGPAGAVESLLEQAPVLRLRRGAGVQRAVFIFDPSPGDPVPPRHPAVRQAPLDGWEGLELLRGVASGGAEPLTPTELAGPARRGHVYEFRRNDTTLGLFRIEGVGTRRIQVTDVCVHPKHRGQGLGTALMQSAANVAKVEFTRGCVVAAPVDEAGMRTAARSGFLPAGEIDDVHFD